MSSEPFKPTTISFQCPHCGQQTDVDSQFAGQSGPCASCNRTISIPTLASLAPQPAEKKKRRSAHPAMRWAMVMGGIAAVVLLGIAAWMVAQPVLKAAREAALCSECESNLVTIGLALEDYYTAKGHYPPAAVLDDNGKPMHSWRVLLLPYLGKEAELVYQKYDMTKPWDSKENSQLEDLIPAVYACPADPKMVKRETSYLAIVGEHTVINNHVATKKAGSEGPSILSDHANETLVIIEAPNSGINWMSPRDVPVAALRAGLNSSNQIAPGSKHSQGVNTLMADGSVIRLPEETSSEDLRGLSTIDGGNEYIEVLDQIQY